MAKKKTSGTEAKTSLIRLASDTVLTITLDDAICSIILEKGQQKLAGECKLKEAK